MGVTPTEMYRCEPKVAKACLQWDCIFVLSIKIYNSYEWKLNPCFGFFEIVLTNLVAHKCPKYETVVEAVPSLLDLFLSMCYIMLYYRLSEDQFQRRIVLHGMSL